MAPKTVYFQQSRGTWIAIAAAERDAKIIGHNRIPVIRDFENGDFAWNGQTLTIMAEIDASENDHKSAWWMQPKISEWRTLLQNGTPILIRKAIGSEHGPDESSVGRKVGIFKTDFVLITPSSFEVKCSYRFPVALS